MDFTKSQPYGFDIYQNWHCRFPIEKLSVESEPKEIVISEPRIVQLTKRLSLKGMRVLELGCLEGMHSFILQMLGVREIIAIEGRVENFLKCLIVKNAFSLDKCRFLFGDVNKILESLSNSFDLCLALGIIYHLKNPVSTLYRIAELVDKLFVWTHFATKDYPQGPFTEIKHGRHIYRGKYVGEDTHNYLAGLQQTSFWIFEDDLLSLISDAGFKDIEVIQKEDHEHGSAMTFLAKK